MINIRLSPVSRVNFKLAKGILIMVTNRTQGAQFISRRRDGVMSELGEKSHLGPNLSHY